MQLNDFFFFFQVKMVFLGTPKSEATLLLRVPLSSSLKALYMMFKDLSECWKFAVEMVTMSDVYFCRMKINQIDAIKTSQTLFFATVVLAIPSYFLN